MTAIRLTTFLGEAPIIAPELLPAGMSTTAVNCNLVSGDLDGFYDMGNPYQLAKTATINTLGQYVESMSTYWLQWMESELATGSANVDFATGAIPGDLTGHLFITGLSIGPCQTNFYYATDPSQKGSSVEFAYPYKTFAIGIANPSDPPEAAQPAAAAGTATSFEYAQQASIQNVTVGDVGSGYVVGDKVTILGGTLAESLPSATAQINNVTATGAVDTGVSGSITLLTGGFYTFGNTPTAPAATSGGTGSGLTFSAVESTSDNSFDGFTPFSPGNGGDFYTQWTINSHVWQCVAGQGGLRICYSNGSFGLQTSVSYVAQMDTIFYDNGSSEYPECILCLSGQPTGSQVGGVFTGPALILNQQRGGFALCSQMNDDNGDFVYDTCVKVASQTGLSISPSTWYRFTATLTASNLNSSPGFNVVATLAEMATPSTIIVTLTGFVPYVGEVVAAAMNHTHTGDNDKHEETAQFQNVYIVSTQAASQVTQESINYVTTDENLFAQESGPSDPSATINVFINGDVTPNLFGPVSISIPPAPSGSYLENLYRSVNLGGANEEYELVTSFAAMTIVSATGNYTVGDTVTGSKSQETGRVLSWSAPTLVLEDCTGVFLLDEDIVESPSGITGTFNASVLDSTTIAYTDDTLDQNLEGTVLVSTNWSPPPPNSQGIVSAANGITAVFSDNLLCLSAARYPHAYPVTNQYPTDDPIVAIAVIGTQFVVFTKGYTYTAYGDDPSAFTMQKETSPQACVSKRSVATHRTEGIIFASANGLAYYRGPGDIDLIRVPDDEKRLKPIFSIQQWKALNPSSIIGIVHDDYYWFWYDNGTTKRGYYIDLARARSLYNQPGFGIVELDFHVTCAFVDYETDTLHLVPDKSVYPINGGIVTDALNVIYEWEAANTKRQKVWERNTIILPRPMGFQILRVRAEDFNDVNVIVANEEGTAFEGQITSPRGRIIANRPGYDLSVTVSGTSRIYSVELSEAIEEIAQ